MAIGLNNTTPRPLGPGYVLLVTGMSGPTPIDDIVTVTLSDTGGGPGHPAYGRSFTRGATFVVIQLGVDETRTYERSISNHLADGASVYVTIQHGSDVVIYPGFTWDPLTQVGQLVATGIAQGGGADTGMLAEILAAVRKTY